MTPPDLRSKLDEWRRTEIDAAVSAAIDVCLATQICADECHNKECDVCAALSRLAAVLGGKT